MNVQIERLLQGIDPRLRRYIPEDHFYTGEQAPLIEMESLYAQQLPALLTDKARVKLSTVSFAFVHDWCLDAYSTVSDNAALIGQNVGSVLLLNDICHSILSHPKALRDIGKPELERIKYTQIERLVDARELKDSEEADIAGSPRCVPIDVDRRRFAQMVVQLALDFMFLHEVGHVVAGHPGYKADHLKAACNFRAFGSPDDQPSEHVLRYHAIELDADWYAIRLLAVAVARRTAITADEYMDGFDTFKLFRALTLAIYILFVCDPTPAPFAVYWSRRDHPHPYFRFLTLEHCVPDQLQLNGLNVVDEWHAAFRKTLADAHWISLMVGFGREFFQDIADIGPKMNDRIEEVYSAHSELLSALRKEGRDLRLE
jgi:hypothetical protein